MQRKTDRPAQYIMYGTSLQGRTQPLILLRCQIFRELDTVCYGRSVFPLFDRNDGFHCIQNNIVGLSIDPQRHVHAGRQRSFEQREGAKAAIGPTLAVTLMGGHTHLFPIKKILTSICTYPLPLHAPSDTIIYNSFLNTLELLVPYA